MSSRALWFIEKCLGKPPNWKSSHFNWPAGQMREKKIRVLLFDCVSVCASMRVTLFPDLFCPRITNWFTAGFCVHKWCGDNHIISSFTNLWPQQKVVALLSEKMEREKSTNEEKSFTVEVYNRITSFGMIFVDWLINVFTYSCLCTKVKISAWPSHYI